MRVLPQKSIIFMASHPNRIFIQKVIFLVCLVSKTEIVVLEENRIVKPILPNEQHDRDTCYL